MHFENYPSSKLLSKLAEVLRRAELLAPKRNDIAHGVVQPHWRAGYVMVPAYYAAHKHTFQSTGDHKNPDYIFTSSEIEEYGEQFRELVQPTMDLVVGVMRQTESPPI